MSMAPFTIVGMPGSGKSTVSKALGDKYGMPVISTDAVIFKEARKDPAHPVTAAFLSTFEQTYGQKIDDPAILQDMPAFVERYTEKVFRDLEEQAIRHAFLTGRLTGVIPDLSGSAFMRSAMRALLRQQRVVSIFLDTPDTLILKNLMKDYEDSKTSGNIKRSGYFHVAKTAADQGRDPSDALDTYSRQGRQVREPHYRQADLTVAVAPDEPVDAVISRVEAVLLRHFEAA